MSRRFIRTDAAPPAIGPYSQAVSVDARGKNTVYCSGQIGLDPATGKLVEGGVEAEARCALENLHAVLAAAGAQFSDIVRTTIFLVDLRDFPAVNAIYASYFEGPPPARATVGVLALPRDARVEIDAIAVSRG